MLTGVALERSSSITKGSAKKKWNTSLERQRQLLVHKLKPFFPSCLTSVKAKLIDNAKQKKICGNPQRVGQ